MIDPDYDVKEDEDDEDNKDGGGDCGIMQVMGQIRSKLEEADSAARTNIAEGGHSPLTTDGNLGTSQSQSQSQSIDTKSNLNCTDAKLVPQKLAQNLLFLNSHQG